MADIGVILRSEDEAAADQPSSMAGGQSRRGVKTPRLVLEQQILALLRGQGEMTISELHRALRASTGLSYSMIQLVAGQMVEAGSLGKVASWPRRYYVIAGADTEEAHQGSSPREIVAAALGRRDAPGIHERRQGREEDLGELEREVLAVARELGLCNLDGLHTTLTERHHVPYPEMLTAVRNLVRRRLLERRRKDNRYVYEARGDE